jgi:predicted Rossmann fold flavoprotein
MLLKECAEAGVDMWLGCRVLTVEKGAAFIVETSRGTVRSGSLVVATGGLSYPQLGATDLGYRLAKRFGLKIIPPRPALVPLVFREEDRHWTELAGLSVEVVAACAGHSFRESLLFTHRGLSGPAILQVSSHWEGAGPITIALSPETDFLKLFEAHRSTRVQMKNVLSNRLPRRLAEKWCERNGLSKTMDQFSPGELKRIAVDLSSWKITPAGTEGYKTAEVTHGGVDTNELSSKTLEARAIPDLYFVGEVVDVTGRLGGFNLHWAWASGAAAGASV